MKLDLTNGRAKLFREILNCQLWKCALNNLQAMLFTILSVIFVGSPTNDDDKKTGGEKRQSDDTRTRDTATADDSDQRGTANEISSFGGATVQRRIRRKPACAPLISKDCTFCVQYFIIKYTYVGDVRGG